MTVDQNDPQSTRNRILDAALALLNARGPAGATTADIAAAAGIREGNLHYHFNRKEQIVAALCDRFEAEVARVADRELTDPGDPESYRGYQFGWFELMWRFRSFYRDGWTLLRGAPGLDGRLAALEARARARAADVLRLAARHGLLAATPGQLERLLHNVWIVSSFWMSYRRFSGAAGEAAEAELAWGFAQILSLYEPYVTTAGRSLALSPAPEKVRAMLA